MDHNARVLCLRGDADVISEMRAIHPEEAGIRHMLPKARHYLVKIESVRRPIAHILKETFLSNGGDAVIHRDVIVAAVDRSDVILCGTRKHFQRAFAALLEQGFGSDRLASEIESAIRHFDSPPVLPDPGILAASPLRRFYENMGQRTLVMGILNITPDSFSDGGRFIDEGTAVARAVQMVEEGADVIDVGGESTRPGAEPVPEADEIERVVPVIRELVASLDVPISIDTYKAGVAKTALDCGASIINDISAASFDPEMPALIAETRCPAILMHIKGTPLDMQTQPTYDDLMGEICGFLRDRIRSLVEAGVDEKLLIVDPGIGFGKRIEHNLEILRRLRELKSIGRPVLVGTSRKSTIGKILGDAPPDDRLEGTAATVALSVANGADIVRVHDVREMARVVKMSDAVVRSE